jgi:hypothetical protein
MMIVLLTVIMIIPFATPVSAANQQFITEIRLEAGEDAVEALEADGWSVMLTGLNMTYDATKQVYLAYKMNTGSPVTNIVISNDVGDSFTDSNGVAYFCAGHTDVDQGIGSGTGCVYYTTDQAAGSPLVGIDILRSKDEALYPITNDGAEIVRNANGTPADIESASDSAMIYLAQLRDDTVRPYISEIGVVTDTDKWNAVYTACERGYNYYVDSDIDDSGETYTILVYKRSADVNDAVTNITAVSENTVQTMVDEQIVDAAAASPTELTGAAISISGVEYVRVSSDAINARQPYYLYQTKNTSAGNPVSMLFAEEIESEQNFIFGTWINGYFSTQGTTSSYMYCANEDVFSALCEDLTVLTKVPVRLLADVASAQTETQGEKSTPDEITADSAENEAENTGEETDEKNVLIGVTMLTPRDGLPESAAQIMGLRDNSVEAPVVEHTERSDRNNKFGASVFGKDGWLIIVLGVAVIAAAVISALIIRKKKSGKVR